MQWFQDNWGEHKDKKVWILKVKALIRELWLKYKGKLQGAPSVNIQNSTKLSPKSKTYASACNHKHLKTVHSNDVATTPITIANRLQEYLETNCLRIGDSNDFNVIQYWLDRYKSQPNLTQFALNILAIPPISDECERLFSSYKILLEDRRSHLQMDIIKANECLRH